MKASINQLWLQQINFDSSSPSGGATVIHRFETNGEYRVRFAQDTDTLTSVQLAVKLDREKSQPRTALPSI